MLHCLAHALCVHYLAAIEIEHVASRTRRCHTLVISGLVYAAMLGTRYTGSLVPRLLPPSAQ